MARIRVGKDSSWKNVNKKSRIQLSKEFMARNGIRIIGPSVLGGALYLLSYLNPVTTTLSAVGTIIVAGVAYKYSTAPTNEDFTIEKEEIADPVVKASDQGHNPDDQGYLTLMAKDVMDLEKRT